MADEHEHDEHDHPHPHPHAHGAGEQGAADGGSEEAPPDISGWIASVAKEPCPACGALGAVRLGGGVFCPSCGVTSTAPGYAPPADDASA